MMKFLAYIVCFLIYPLSFLVPRTKKIWTFGSYRGAFNDNSKYLFLYTLQYLPEQRVVWISLSKTTVQRVRQLGGEAYWIMSPKGIWFALRSKYWFVNTNTADILFCLSGRAQVVNLWHGLPMKKIEFGITQGELAKRYIQREFWEAFYHPACFRRPDWMVSTTDFFDDVFTKSFRIAKKQCIQTGCPRNRMLLIPKQDVQTWVNSYESEETKKLIRSLQHYDKVFVYMPTWRDSQRECFANGFDLDAFNECLKSQNAFALMKPHVETIIDTNRSFSNLLFIDGNVDMYCILPFTDVLITDYSSVLYDYILMPDKNVILFHYDYDEYVREREFIFPIKDNIVGKVVYSFTELLSVITTHNYSIDQHKRQTILEKFWGKTARPDYDASHEILKALHLLDD